MMHGNCFFPLLAAICCFPNLLANQLIAREQTQGNQLDSAILEKNGSGPNADQQKYVEISSPQSQTIFISDSRKVVNVVFVSPLLDQQEASCVLDKDALNVSMAGLALSPSSVSCDLGPLSLPVGHHHLWAIRSPQLRQSTLLFQTPVQLDVLVMPGGGSQPMTNFSSKPTDRQTYGTFHPKAARLGDQMDKILVDMTVNEDESQTTIAGGNMKINVTAKVDCAQLLGTMDSQMSKIGANSECIITGNGADVAELVIPTGPSSTIRVGDKILLKSFQLSDDSSSPVSKTLQLIEGKNVELTVRNATHPSIPFIDLSTGTKSINICASNGSDVQFNVSSHSGAGNRSLTCKWTFKTSGGDDLLYSKFIKAVNDCSLSFPVKLIAETIKNLSALSTSPPPIGLEVSVIGCNFAGLCSSLETISIPLSFAIDLDVKIVSLPSETVPSERVSLNSKTSYSECGTAIIPFNISYTWFLNELAVSNSSTFTIPAFQFAAGSVVSIRLQATRSLDGLSASHSQILTYRVQPLVTIANSNARGVAANSPLLLDTSASWSPNTRQWPLQHDWRCLNLTSGTVCRLDLQQQAQYQHNNGAISIGSGRLQEGGRFMFLDTVRDEVNATAQIPISIEVLPELVPSIKVLSDEQSSISSGFFKVRAFVSSSVAGNLSLKWTLSDSKNQSIDLDRIFPLQANKNLTVESNRVPPLVVPFSVPISRSSQYPDWPGLLPGQIYTLRLLASNSKGTAFADHQIELNPMPSLTPNDGMVALDTLIRLQPSGQSSLANSSLNRIRFGIRYLLVGNKSKDQWYRASSQFGVGDAYYELYLPTAWPQPHASCGERIGYQGLFEVCDRIWGHCSTLVSENFTVGHFSLDALGKAIQIIWSRVLSGNPFGALELLDAVNQELCGSWNNAQLLNEILDDLIASLANSTDLEELMEALEYTMRLVGVASEENVEQIMELLNRTKTAIFYGTGGNNRNRQRGRAKRDIGSQQQIVQNNTVGRAEMSQPQQQDGTNQNQSVGSQPKKITEMAATTLLGAYDVLLGKDQDVVGVYLSNIRELISSFCIQVDATIGMQANGKIYTTVGARGVVPGNPDFLTNTFPLAGNSTKILRFDTTFATMFTNWICANGQTTCTDVCLGSALTSMLAVRDNEYLRQRLFMPNYAMLGVDQAVSHLHHIYLLDPTNGNDIAYSAGAFSVHVNVSMASHLPSAFYKCFLFTGTNWDESACDSPTTPKLASPGQFQLLCNCRRVGGILGVFNVNPPIPPSYPYFNEIALLFTLSTSDSPSSGQLATFINNLFKATGVSVQRFVNVTGSVSANSSSVVVSTILRPAFRLEQLSNSYAMQAISRTVQCDGGFTAYENVVVQNMSGNVVKRKLYKDGNARRIPLQMNRSFKEVFGENGNDTTNSTAIAWLNSMAKNMRISEYRLKNPVILSGILFNFTITIPFDGELSNEKTPLSAEEIALWIKEMTFYGELDLRDQRDQPMSIQQLSLSDIVELVVLSPTNPLVYVLGGVVGCAITFSTLFIGTLIFLKIRSEKMRKRPDENFQVIDLSHAAPITVRPYDESRMTSGSDSAGKSRRRKRRGGGQIRVEG